MSIVEINALSKAILISKGANSKKDWKMCPLKSIRYLESKCLDGKNSLLLPFTSINN